MEDRKTRESGFRQETRNDPQGPEGLGIPPGNPSLGDGSRRDYRLDYRNSRHYWPSWASYCLSLALLLLPSFSHSYTGSTSGEPLNIFIPDEDSYDWGTQYDWNFSVMRSSINNSLVNYSSIANSTQSIQAALTALTTNVYMNFQNSTAPVRSGMVSFSTITTALNLKANSFVGVSSTCASGQFWDAGHLTNGVADGGICTAASAFAGSGTGSTGTWSFQSLTVDGTWYFVAGTNYCDIYLIGGGGAGGGIAVNADYGAGGGGSGQLQILSVTPSTNIVVHVGSATATTAAGSNGAHGTVTCADYSNTGTACNQGGGLLRALGGLGGGGKAANTSPGADGGAGGSGGGAGGGNGAGVVGGSGGTCGTAGNASSGTNPGNAGATSLSAVPLIPIIDCASGGAGGAGGGNPSGAGGGGGYSYGTKVGTGAIGGNSGAINGIDATANTGGGGGAGAAYTGATGGKGASGFGYILCKR